MGRVLFVVTSHSALGNTGQKTGYYLSEVAHPFQVLQEAGYAIDFVSPKGGKAPMDPKSYKLDDPINKAFWETYGKRLEETRASEQVDPSQYVAIFYAGGHGTMWDFPENEALARIVLPTFMSEVAPSGQCAMALLACSPFGCPMDDHLLKDVESARSQTKKSRLSGWTRSCLSYSKPA